MEISLSVFIYIVFSSVVCLSVRLSLTFNSDLDLDHRTLSSNPKLGLNVSYPYTKFCVNRPKLTKVIEKQTEFLFLVTVTLTLITDTLVAIPSRVLI